jgi:hypothetical protein
MVDAAIAGAVPSVLEFPKIMIPKEVAEPPAVIPF